MGVSAADEASARRFVSRVVLPVVPVGGGTPRWRRSSGGRGGNLRGLAEVPEDAPDDIHLLDHRDQAHGLAAPRAGEHVEPERAAHQGRPRPSRRVRPLCRAISRGSRDVGRVPARAWRLRGVCADNLSPPRGPRGENPVVQKQVDAGAEREHRKAFEQLGRLEQEMPARASGEDRPEEGPLLGALCLRYVHRQSPGPSPRGTARGALPRALSAPRPRPRRR